VPGLRETYSRSMARQSRWSSMVANAAATLGVERTCWREAYDEPAVHSGLRGPVPGIGGPSGLLSS